MPAFSEDPCAPVPEDGYTLLFPHEEEDGEGKTFTITPEMVESVLADDKKHLADDVFEAICEKNEKKGYMQKIDGEDGTDEWLQEWFKECVADTLEEMTAEDNEEDEEESEDEVLVFTGLNGYQKTMTVAEWRKFPEYGGKDAKKAVAFGSKGSQFEFCYKPE